MDAIKKNLSCQPCNRITVSIFVTFFVTISALGIGSLQTMQVSHNGGRVEYLSRSVSVLLVCRPEKKCDNLKQQLATFQYQVL